ncbi:hypothetical protein MASR2M78_22200 [Treponema sp.]
MKRFISTSTILSALAFVAATIVATTFVACSISDDTATVYFALTDAPVTSGDIEEVYVQFSSVRVHESTSAGELSSGWISVPVDSSHEYELLSLSNGLSEALGSIQMKGGTRINQIRFAISKLELVEGDDLPGDARHTVSLASATGLKIVNAFDIPLSGEIKIVVDFDVHKSLVNTGTSYKMKPVLRAIVDNEAGEIHGSAPVGYMVYAYKSGSDFAVTLSDPANDADAPDYDDAYTSARVREEGNYTLAFMDAGAYDLVLVAIVDGSVAQVVNDVVVESAKGTLQNISILP